MRTEFLSARASSAAIRIRIDDDSHRLELHTEAGRFCGLTTAVDVCLHAWFHESYRLGGSDLVDQLVAHIRARHEDKLPRPRPRQLPLTLPAFGPKTACNVRGNKAQREKRAMATVEG